MPRERLSLSTGRQCEACGADNWLVYEGHNRCACGRYLWIEKHENGDGRRLRYVQGVGLPDGYRGWAKVTA